MKIKEFIIIPSSIEAMGLIHKPGTGPNNRFGFKNVGNNKANEYDETKEAPPGTYFTKTGNLVKGRLTKAAKERGARETDPKDSQRSKVPPVSQTNEEESNIDLQLPTGKKMVLQADDEKHTRGLVVTSNEDGSYDTYYWYENPNEPMPIEVKIDGETVSKDAKNVRWEYHPELEEARGTCWHGYQQKGYKKKGNKMVPNCVKEEAAGVGIVTKQNATKDVPVGGEYMNVKKLGLGKGKPKTMREEFAEFLENIDPKVWTELRAKGLVRPMEYDSPEVRAAYKAQGKPYKPEISIITKDNMDHFRTKEPERLKQLKPIRVSDQEWIDYMDNWWRTERFKPEGRDKVQQIKNAYKLLYKKDMVENFADGKRKGKSRPGRVKRAGASCKGSVTSLRAKAKKSSGERAKMYHWCANMKSGRKKKK